MCVGGGGGSGLVLIYGVTKATLPIDNVNRSKERR